MFGSRSAGLYLWCPQVEPGFTTLVWQKLEEQNPDFFRAYHIRLNLKDQVRPTHSLCGAATVFDCVPAFSATTVGHCGHSFTQDSYWRCLKWAIESP